MSYESYKEGIEKEIETERKEIGRLSDEVLKIGKVLRKRSRTLNRLLILKVTSLNLLDSYPFNPYDFEAKRGRKSKSFPIKGVMHILEVSHRTAQDYVRILRALDLIDEWAEHKIRFYHLMLQLKMLKEGGKTG